MPAPFDPAAHPALRALVDRLPELAGTAAYAAGRDYARRGLVSGGTVAGEEAHAEVAGSTVYRVRVGFGAEPTPGCTCPAHRRSRWCKHVVAVALALVEQPARFVPADPAAAPPAPAKRAATRREPGAKARGEAQRAEQRAAGLAVVDRLLEELAAGGVVGLGAEKVALLEAAGETVRALKLRRLGNGISALQRAAADPALPPARFAELLTDLWRTRRAVGAYLETTAPPRPELGDPTLGGADDGVGDGGGSPRHWVPEFGAGGGLDSVLAEELVGKTWRESELERVGGLELVPLAEGWEEDGAFRVETSWLGDPATGAVYAEKQITPVRLRGTPKARPRLRLLVDEAGLYPGPAPRRVKLVRVRRAALGLAEMGRLVAHAAADLPTLRARLVEHLADPFAPAALAVLFRPAGLLAGPGGQGAVDGAGRWLPLEAPPAWTAALPPLLPDPGEYALFGLLGLDAGGRLVLRPLSVVGALRWGEGPRYPG